MMSNWRGGKGSRQRPMSVDKDEFNRRFDEIFTGRKAGGEKKNDSNDKKKDDTAK